MQIINFIKRTNVILLLFLIGACQTIEKNEFDYAIRWIRRIPHNVLREKRIFLEYDIIPEKYQKQYFKILEKKHFTIIDNYEYLSMFRKSSSKRYIIVFRAVAHSPVSNFEINREMVVFRTDGTNVICSLQRWPVEGFSDDDFKKLFLHRILLVTELDVLPKDIYALTFYTRRGYIRNEGISVRT